MERDILDARFSKSQCACKRGPLSDFCHLPRLPHLLCSLTENHFAPLALLAPDHFWVCPSPIALEVLHGKGMPSTSPSHKSASIAARFEADLWLVGYFRVCPSPIALEVLLG